MRRLCLLVLSLTVVACRPPAPPSNAPAETPIAASTQEPGRAIPTPAPGETPAPGAATRPAVPSATPDERLGRPLRVKHGSRTWSVTASGLGLTSLPATGDDVRRAIGGAPELPRVLREMAGEVERAPSDARLALNPDGSIEYAASEEGRALDQEASRERIVAGLADGSSEVELTVRAVPPKVPEETVRSAREQLRRILERQGTLLTVRGAERSWELDRAEVAFLLRLEGSPVRVTLNDEEARNFAKRLARALDREPSNARFTFAGGQLKPLREGTAGRAVDQEQAVDLMRSTILGAGDVIDLKLNAVNPAVPANAEARDLGIVEQIEKGSTSLAGAIPEKKHNVKIAAERLNGVVVPPGATFSFNREVGPTTIEAGYKWGFGITSGEEGIKTVPSVAGGICQVATTLFQPVFWAGYPLEERYWHLYWIPSYTSRNVVGLDVTVDEPAGLDFKWVNTSKSHVLIQASADDATITFTLYGSKPGWNVQVADAKISNRVPPDTKPVAEEEPTLPWGRTIQVEAAREGFDVEVTRTVTGGDLAEPRVLNLKSNYQPSRTVTLVGTGGKPAGASVEDALARAVAPPKPAQNRPAATPAGRAADSPAKPGAPPATPTVRPSDGAPPKPAAVVQAPAATNQPAPATTPRTGASIPPTVTPALARAATPTPVPRAPTQATPVPAGTRRP